MLPLGADDFARLMAAAEPFETAPHLAVGVSGGADSMALCLLAQAWATARGGRVLALTVDHGLRGASAAEAAWVAGRLSALGIEHATLCWAGDKPRTGVEAKARQARYRLLSEYCRDRGILHLLVGHHRRDQGETVQMRAARNSTAYGLAAMATVAETGCVRVIRPLLCVSPLRLRAYLQARGQAWLEDPMNRDPAFARARMRARSENAAQAGTTEDAAVRMARGHGERRARVDAAVADLLARHARLHPAGHMILDGAALAAAPAAIVAAALARIVTTVGGKAYAPGSDAMQRLRRGLRAGRAAALGRCTWHWLSPRATDPSRGVRLLVCREMRGLPAPLTLAAPGTFIWDGRFRVRVGALEESRYRGLAISPLGEEGWCAAKRAGPSPRWPDVPRRAALSLPAVRDADGLLAIPTLDWGRADARPGGRGASLEITIALRPLRSLSGTGYFLA